MRPRTIALTLLVMVTACDPFPHKTYALSPLTDVTEVRISDANGLKSLKTITNTTEVRRIIDFVNAHRDGWEVPMAGVPVARLMADFYDGKNYHGRFGAGEGFFETDLTSAPFASRSVSEDEIRKFLALLGISRAEFTSLSADK